MRTQRDAIVTRSGGTKSARTTNVVDGGGSSIVLSRRAAASAVRRWNSWRTMTLRAPSTGASGGDVDDLAGLLGGDRRAGALDLVDVGVLAARGPGGRRARLGSSTPGEQHGGERPGRLVLRRARRADEQVGVHRRRDGRAQRGDGGRLADDVVPHAASRRRRPATASDAGGDRVGVAGGVDDAPALRVGGGHRPEAGDDALVELGAGPLEAVEVAAVRCGAASTSGGASSSTTCVGQSPSIAQSLIRRSSSRSSPRP